MDNILKLLLGVLSVAGLIAMVTPTNLAVTPEPAPPPEAVAAPVLSENGDEILTDEQMAEESPEDGDDFAIGEPTIDGNPIGVSNDQQQPQPEPPIPFDATYPGANFAYGPSAMGNYAPPVNYSPQPVPGTIVSVNTGE